MIFKYELVIQLVSEDHGIDVALQNFPVELEVTACGVELFCAEPTNSSICDEEVIEVIVVYGIGVDG